MYDTHGLTVEAVMRMPFCRFMALQRLKTRQSIQERNARAREQHRAKIAREG